MVGALCVMVGSYYYISTGATTETLFWWMNVKHNLSDLKIIIIPGGNILTAKKITSQCMLLIRLLNQWGIVVYYSTTAPFPLPSLCLLFLPLPFFSLSFFFPHYCDLNIWATICSNWDNRGSWENSRLSINHQWSVIWSNTSLSHVSSTLPIPNECRC